MWRIGFDAPLDGLFVAVLNGDGDAYLAAELVRQRRGDERAEAVLQVVLGELVRGGEQCGVLYQSERTGKSNPGSMVRSNCVVIESPDGACPHFAEVGAVVH